MTQTPNEGQRLPWKTPTLKRIVAGAAEAITTAGKNDGAKTGNDKS